MSNSFFDAALSYYGLGETRAQVEGLANEGGPVLLLRIPLGDEDLAGIVARMQRMSELAPVPSYTEQPDLPSDERMRDEYNGMDKCSKSEFGSFHRYKAWRLGQAADAMMTDKVELPAHVYLSPAECTPQQRAMAIGQDEKGNYAIAVEDLTDGQCVDRMDDHPGAAAEYRRRMQEMDVHLADGAGESLDGGATMRKVTAGQLRQAYVERTVAAMERLNGADGKPTSNADDFGGLPG